MIEIARTSTGHIRHVPAGRADVRDLLLSSLTGRLGAELDRWAGVVPHEHLRLRRGRKLRRAPG